MSVICTHVEFINTSDVIRAQARMEIFKINLAFDWGPNDDESHSLPNRILFYLKHAKKLHKYSKKKKCIYNFFWKRKICVQHYDGSSSTWDIN